MTIVLSGLLSQMDQPGFGMSGRDYYLEESLSHMRTAYVTLAKNIAELFGASPTDAQNFAERMLQFETDIANVRN